MKRPIKKTLAFILSLAIALQLISVSTHLRIEAAQLSDFDLSEDGLSIYGYLGTDENVKIPAGISSVYLYNDDVIKKLTLPEGVTSLSISSTTLESISIPSTLSYLYLSGCPSLTKLDFSKVDGTISGYYDICDLSSLKTIKFGTISGNFYIDSVPEIEKLDFSNANLSYISIVNCDSLKDISFNKASEASITLYNLNSIEEAIIPENASLFIGNLDFDAIILNNNNNGFSVKDGGFYYNYLDDEGNDIKVLEAIDTNLTTINVVKGTTVIQALGLSGNFYKTEAINLPDSVEMIASYAFEGADGLKSLSIPKNCISIGAYAFSGLNSEIELTIPASIQYINEEAFGGFKGKVSLAEETEALSEYEDGIYLNYSYSYGDETYNYSQLVYYPYNKAKIVFSPDTTSIGTAVFMDTVAKTLNIPEGVTYYSTRLDNAFNLTSISIPSTAYYIDCQYFNEAPALKKLTVDKNNEYYTSYKNCLYDKEMTTLLAVPGALTKVVIPEGVLSLSYYAIYPHYVNEPDGGSKYVVQDVSFPKSLTNFDEFYFNSATCYADTPVAEYIVTNNLYSQFYADLYGYEPTLLNYTLKDSLKSLLKMIYVIDSVSVKKGETAFVEGELPSGVTSVTDFTLKNNTECKVKFSSSNKKIAKVDPYSGEITGVKKGTCTVNVKCTMTDGKKTKSKTFKVKVKVK